MKALTIWQPWASLIMAGVKPYEFRSWPAPKYVRGKRSAIHAGARPVRRTELQELILQLRSPEAYFTGLKPEALPLLEGWLQNPGRLPLSSILGTAVIGEPRRDAELLAEFGGPVMDSDRAEHHNWAWPLSDIEHLEPFHPAKGALGFWDCRL